MSRITNSAEMLRSAWKTWIKSSPFDFQERRGSGESEKATCSGSSGGIQSIKYVLPCANKHRMASSMNLNRILEKNPHIRRDQLEDGLEFSEQIRPAGVKPGVEKRVNSKRV